MYPLNLGRCESTLHYGGRAIQDQWKEALDSAHSKRIILNSRILPTVDAIEIITLLEPNQQWIHKGELIAECEGVSEGYDAGINHSPTMLETPEDLFERCGEGLAEDLDRIQYSWRTRTLSEDERSAWTEAGVFVHGEMERIHLAPGAVVRNCTLNTEEGDIVVGPDAELMEGCRVRGPFLIGPMSQLKMGTLVYGPTSIGAHSKVGGELSNVVIHDYSNKAHGGFLGNSVIGSWCNLGAETSSSNLKNNYSEISVFNQENKTQDKRGRTFCGLLMGDHSKTAIHTAFNTATVVGAFCNVFGSATPKKHIPSFTWGGGESSEIHNLEKAIETARRVMLRRGVELSKDQEKEIGELYKASAIWHKEI